MRRPVFLLKKALYGHPDSGTFWEEHCDERVQVAGFKPIADLDGNWRSCYFNAKTKVLLTIYVDDFKM